MNMPPAASCSAPLAPAASAPRPPPAPPTGRAAEQAAFVSRREVAGVPPDAPSVGLALSGGGIRSATFCYGLLRGLAERGLLGRIDYLSTVSGGGYIGAALGRMFDAKAKSGAPATPDTARAVQRGWADAHTLAAWWLRRNGRYLTPTGVGDFGFAAATYLRAWVAVHIEAGMIALLAALVILLPHLSHFGSQLPRLDVFDWIQSAWWTLALAFVLATVPGLLWGYWIARDPPARRPAWGDVLLWVAAVLACLALLPRLAGHDGDSLWLEGSALAAASLAIGAPIAAYASFSQVALRRGGTRWARNLYTRRLRDALRIAGLMALAGLIDWASWNLLLVLRQPSTSASTWIGSGAALLIALRALLEPVQQHLRARSEQRSRRLGAQALNALGIAATLVLLLVWTTLAQALVFLPARSPAWFAWPESIRWTLLLALVLAWGLLTRGNLATANATSLHSFYRARLARAYLGIGNSARFDGPSDRRASDLGIVRTQPITDVAAGDDTDLCAYAPDHAGGPLHLVNACINQTIDDRSGLYNLDRKGVALCASRFGLQAGPGQDYEPGWSGKRLGTLGQWIAISGAAASGGAGAHTSRGLAALMFFFGARLGHWWPSGRPPARTARLSTRLLGKFALLGSELTARFAGARSAWWYLSDGGHFENTAAYALIKRELDFVIVADCGADPDYVCGDLENLARKARIDFGAEIQFYEAHDAQRFFAQPGGQLAILSPYELVDAASMRGAMLARILYASGKQGTMLVIKPNLHAQLDFDVLRYAQDHPLFPQQPTSDQFFDEAQWESYHRLGFDFGHALTDAWLAQLPGWSLRRPHAQTRPVALRAPAAGTLSETSSGQTLHARRPWSRAARAAALGTTIGLGALFTGAVAAWQALEQTEQSRRADADRYDELLGSVAERLGDPPAFDASLPLRLDLERLRDSIDLATPHAARAFLDLQAQVGDACRARLERSASDPGCLWWQTRFQRDREQLRRAELGPLDYWRRDGAVISALLDAGAVVLARVDRLVGGRPARVTSAPSPSPSPSSAASSSAASSASTAGRPPPVAQDPCPGAAVVDLSACQAQGATPTVLYTQVYEDASRLQAQPLLQALRAQQVDGFTVGAVENVVETARRRNRPEPAPWRRPTLLVHAPGGRATSGAQATFECAAALARVVRACRFGETVAVRSLPAGLKPTPGVIELWLPPADGGSTGGGW